LPQSCPGAQNVLLPSSRQRSLLPEEPAFPFAKGLNCYAHAPPDLTHEPFGDWPAPSADDYLNDPQYPYEV
jgi:hypothetical protein